MFITEDDYKVVIGDTAMKVVSQASAENRANAEREAQEEISGYLRPKYDCNAEPSDCDVHLRHCPLPHGFGYASKDGFRHS